jgi:ubiquinone/menaquinone biosynthesis C-methylase UbiE
MTENHIKDKVKQQYADRGRAYADSKVHADSTSLAHLVSVVDPRPDWRVLDIATGSGHTALTFMPHVRRVVATDLTFGMVQTAANIAGERGHRQFSPAAADAEALPFAAQSFHLLTCRLAPHHFPRPERFVDEAARVLVSGGLLAIVDNVVPGGRNKADQATGRYVNAFEKLRDPSHSRCLSTNEWHELFYQTGFTLVHAETTRKRLAFGPYVQRMKVAPLNRVRLEAMLVQAPAGVQAFLTPDFDGGTIGFYLAEALFVCRLGPNYAHAR